MTSDESHSPAPNLLALIVCDRIYVDRRSGNHIISGTYNMISTPQVPCAHHGLAVYAAVDDCRGEYHFRIKIIPASELPGDPEDRENSIAGAWMNEPVRLTDPHAVFEMNFDFGMIQFPDFGDYKVCLFANQEYLGARTVSVVKRE